MPAWHENMTMKDHERNREEMRLEKLRELSHAKRRARYWAAEVRRLEKLIFGSDTT